jgi:DNA polymerase V
MSTINTKRGGKRLNAGRPKGLGKFGEATKPIRVPISKLDKIYKYIDNSFYSIPFYSNKISAGFPSPAEDYIDSRLDLNDLLIKNPNSTFFLKVAGDSMLKASINDGDILLVDKSLEAKHNDIVIAVLDNEFTVKRLYKKDGKILLIPENDKYKPINIEKDKELAIWGVVTSVIHKL